LGLQRENPVPVKLIEQVEIASSVRINIIDYYQSTKNF